MKTALVFCAAVVVGIPLHAQQLAAIERIKLGDNELTCAQLNGEVLAMDKAVQEARDMETQGQSTQTAGAAGGVAAQVAQRSGVFGQIGGLFGQIAGSVAAQTAASVTQQSGQQTVVQAQERQRQAQARKEHLTALFLNRGCKTSDLAYNPPPGQQSRPAVVAAAPLTSPGAAIGQAAGTALAAPNPVLALPELDPDAHFKGKMGGTFGKNVTEVLPNSKRVAIAGFRVAFITHNSVSAQVRASYMPGRDTSGASSRLNLALSGVDAAPLQTLTDRAYADFVAQLKLAGREVMTTEQLAGFFSSVEATATSPGRPYSKEVGGQTAQFYAPSGMPLWFQHLDAPWTDRTPFDLGNYRRLAEHASQWNNAIVVTPLIVVNFARMMSSGNQSGLLARAAETGAELSMHVASFSSGYLRSEEFRNGITMKGDEGGIQMAAPLASNLAFGQTRETSSENNAAVKGVFDALGQAAGLANAGGANRSTSNLVAITDNAAYGAAAQDALGRATGTFARLFQKYPAR
jgi:hypothetical protein